MRSLLRCTSILFLHFPSFPLKRRKHFRSFDHHFSMQSGTEKLFSSPPRHRDTAIRIRRQALPGTVIGSPTVPEWYPSGSSAPAGQGPTPPSPPSTTTTAKGPSKKSLRPKLPTECIAVQFQRISATDLDTGAENYVKEFLRQQQCFPVPEIESFDVPHTTLKRCILLLHLHDMQVYAIGQSKKKKMAQLVCYMHAMQLLHHYHSNMVTQRSPPLPLEVGEGVVESAVPLNGDGSSAAVTSRWTAPRSEEDVRMSYYCRMEIPPSTNPIVNQATDVIQKDGLVGTDSLSKLNQCIPGSSAQLISVPIAKKVHTANFVIDREAGLIATGVAENPKLAKMRCAAHALQILALCKKQAGNMLPTPGLSASRDPDGTTSLTSLIQSLPKHNQLLFRFLQRLFRISPKRTFEQKMIENGPGVSVTCYLELDDMRCTGTGSSSFEAERRAMDHAISEMQLCDERVAALNTFISCYPSIQPQFIPSARLSSAVRQQIMALSAEEKKTFPETPGSVFDAAHVSLATSEEDMKASALGEVKPPHPEEAARLSRELSLRLRDPAYKDQFHSRRSTLAMHSVKDHLLRTVSNNQVVVIAGTTGCGKTTQVPQYLFDDAIENGCGDQCNILVTQPRRLSTFSVSHRIASERLSAVGGDVGYAVRFDSNPGRHINVCTTGVLLQILSKHPYLEHVSHLVLDEVHERDINCDFILALVRKIIHKNRRIRILLMSATIEAKLFASYFSGAPIIKVVGSVFPVSIYHLDDLQQMLQQNASQFASFENFSPTLPSGRGNYRGPPSPSKFIDYDLIAYLVHYSAEHHLVGGSNATKSILVFLPGWKELTAAKQAIENYGAGRSSARCHMILLHSSVDTALQRTCFLPPPPGLVKVVLATNIAESGITIDDVAVVIDTGLIKETSWTDHSANSRAPKPDRLSESLGLGLDYSSSPSSSATHSSMSTQLKLKYASRANCTQRTGRAGRTQGGVCYRLFSRAVDTVMLDFPEPEIHRLPLSQVILKCLSLGFDPETFLQEFIEPPHPKHISISTRQLQYLGAVTQGDTRLTPLGLYLSRLPCDPRLGKMIIMGAVLRCLDSALTVAATTDVSPFVTNRQLAAEVARQRYILSRRSQSDPITALNAYNAFCANKGDPNFAHHNYLNIRQLQMLSQYKQQYRDILQKSGFIRLKEENSYENASVSSSTSSQHENDANESRPGGLFIDTSPISEFALNIPLVKACIASSLYPNIAVLALEGRTTNKKKITLRTQTISSVGPASGSVCKRIDGPPGCNSPASPTTASDFIKSLLLTDENRKKLPAMFYVFQDVFRVDSPKLQFLRDVSSISLWALLLFCGSRESFMSYNQVLGIGVIEEWIAVKIDKETFEALMELRRVMDSCLLRKYKNPFDKKNNALLESFNKMCHEVLCAKSGAEEGVESWLDACSSLTDTGSIVSPFKESYSSSSDVGEDYDAMEWGAEVGE